nr:YciI family protein [uncultured Roseateles sp.]
MTDYILLMHDDVPAECRTASEAGWDGYIAKLAASGRFSGGSSIGPGACFRKDGAARATSSALLGYIRVQAESLDEAQKLLAGNPTFEAGGTVEIRELPQG